MSSHELAINKLIENGIRCRNLQNILASNCVVDWFGRTLVGQQKAIDFYHNSNTNYEHTILNIVNSEAIEERSHHHLTREHPPENLKSLSDIDVDQWYDCKSHSPSNLKEGQKTPEQRMTSQICPGAPCRPGMSFLPFDSDIDDSEDEEEEGNVSGIRPLDASVELEPKLNDKSPACKKLRRGNEETNELSSNVESNFSDLFYVEATGVVAIKRQPKMSDELEKRDCRMLVSYRTKKTDPNFVQIALIVYKSNTKNPKTRRNLMLEFREESVEFSTPTLFSRSQTEERIEFSIDGKNSSRAATVPAENKTSKAVKRPLNSKTSLRF
ncbi:CLUMA_CG021391, isoform A [Clunio marinus]|uniref:CLUMA_CG021391, isoform A n=1 Tax=Clunio marinus TaxID=568069 RepID=A0A1J1J8K9_9DIPT|nr:CLUMA_CG021391, isoform A [Clunio marinus]